MEPETLKPLLIADAGLLGAAILQAVLGALFFRPGATVFWFVWTSTCCFASGLLAFLLLTGPGLTAAWLLTGLGGLFFLFGFRAWRPRKQDDVENAPEAPSEDEDGEAKSEAPTK